MPRRKSPILQNISSFMNVPILLAKMRKPITLKGIFLKKSSFKYDYISRGNQSYRFGRKQSKKRYLKGTYTNFSLCRCLGNFGERRSERKRDYPLFKFNYIPEEVEKQLEYNYREEDSVDKRAEKFIKRFYEEIKRQGSESSYFLEEY